MTPPFPQTSRVKKGHSFGHGLDISEFKREDGWVGCFYQIILCNFVWTKLPSPLVSINSFLKSLGLDLFVPSPLEFNSFLDNS